MRQEGRQEGAGPVGPAATGGLTGWLWRRLRSVGGARPRLRVVERLTLAPKQSLALIEVDGRRFLVAASAEGTPGFFALDGETAAPSRASSNLVRAFPRQAQERAARVSW